MRGYKIDKLNAYNAELKRQQQEKKKENENTGLGNKEPATRDLRGKECKGLCPIGRNTNFI